MKKIIVSRSVNFQVVNNQKISDCPELDAAIEKYGPNQLLIIPEMRDMSVYHLEVREIRRVITNRLFYIATLSEQLPSEPIGLSICRYDIDEEIASAVRYAFLYAAMQEGELIMSVNERDKAGKNVLPGRLKEYAERQYNLCMGAISKSNANSKNVDFFKE